VLYYSFRQKSCRARELARVVLLGAVETRAWGHSERAVGRSCYDNDQNMARTVSGVHIDHCVKGLIRVVK
jgi:hypothetical protein